jgi:hypothetical protein
MAITQAKAAHKLALESRMKTAEAAMSARNPTSV